MFIDTNQHQPVVAVENLTIRTDAGVDLVRDVSFALHPGATLGIVGESGSGKSLTCRAILGLLPDGISATGGRVDVLGTDMRSGAARELREVRRTEIGAVFQDPGSYLNPSARIGAQIAESVVVHENCSAREAKARTIELLDEVGLSPGVATQFPFELSGGMLQRVLIAIALSGKPAILIADEVTTALDVVVQAQIIDLLQRHKAQRGVAMVMVSHDLALVSQVCDHLVVMKDGVVVEQGPRRGVLRQPAHPYTRLLIANHRKYGLDEYARTEAAA